jgi:tRNA threonylcarbamoyl adenosine modification protein YeaZ
MQLAIACSSDEAGIGLAVDGVLGLELIWRSEQQQSVELLPNIERLLTEAVRTKADIDAVFVDIGPGGYAALRVGVSVAKATAHGLGVPLVGVGRLELDAYGVVAHAGDRRIVPVHRAGRGEMASASYRGATSATFTEIDPPRMLKRDAFDDVVRSGDALTGDVDDEMELLARERGAVVLRPDRHRVWALAALGHARLAAGRIDDPGALVPLYLRAPAIGPQKT